MRYRFTSWETWDKRQEQYIIKMFVTSSVTVSTLVLPDRLGRSLRRQGGPQEMVAFAAMSTFTLTDNHPVLERCPPCTVYCLPSKVTQRNKLRGKPTSCLHSEQQ